MRSAFSVVLCSAIIFSSCHRTPDAVAMRVDPALAELVPANTALLVGAHLDKLRDTPLYQKMFSQMALPRVDEFAKETGLDPRKDISEVLFASDGTQSGLLMARGKFNTSQLAAKLEQQGSTRTRYKDRDLFGDARNSVCFLDSSTAIAGSTPVVKTVIDGHGNSGVPAALQSQLAAVARSAQFWAVFSGSVIKLPFADDSNLGNLNQIVRSIDNGRFAADLSNGLEFQASGVCNNDAGARQIHDTLRGLIGLGRLSTPENQPELLRVYDGINVKQEGRAVNIAANIPPGVVDKFVSLYTGSRR